MTVEPDSIIPRAPVWARLLASPTAFVVILLALVVVGTLSALPHANEAIWQDEAATLSFHVSRGVIDPFLHYLSPNSHIAFTSMLAAWMKLFPAGVDVFSLRLLPLLLFVLAIPVTFLAGYRLGGLSCAIAAGAIFSSSPVSENFATQLRGYGPSWLFFSAMLLCAMNSLGRRAPAWRIGFFLSAMGAIALLPTNFFFAMVVAIASASYLALDVTVDRKRKREACVLLLGTPIICLLLAYAGVWDELFRFSGVDFSDWTRSSLIREWLRGSLSNVLWISPLVGAGLVVALSNLSEAVTARHTVDRELILAILILVGFLAVIGVMPNVPFPRTLVPFLPVWITAFSYVMVYGLRMVLEGRHRAAFAIGLVASAMLLAGSATPTCRNADNPGGYTGYDLCYQYFRDQYDPRKVLDVWADTNPGLPIVTGFEGYHALGILGSPARIFEFRMYVPSRYPLPLIVARDAADLANMAKVMKIGLRSYGLVADTGYFKVYAPRRDGETPDLSSPR